MEDALITVIVPVYNVAPYLEKCIESILNQTYEKLEVLLVDDGSTDASGRICDRYAGLNQRIRVIHKENGGLVTARKEGLVHAKGEYVGFVDSDDYIDAEFYELLFQGLTEEDADISQMGYWAEDETGSQKFGCTRRVFDLSSHRMDLLCGGLLERRRQEFDISYNVWSKLYKADVIKSCYSRVPDIQQFGEDVICTCCCMLYAGKISVISEEKYHHYIRRGSLSNETGLDYFVKQGNLYAQLKRVFQNHAQYLKIKDSIDIFFKERILAGLHMFGARVNRYAFPKMEIVKGKNVILYGAGSVGRDYYTQLCMYRQCNVVVFMDKNFDHYHYDYVDVVGKDSLPDLKFDLILISVLKEEAAFSIKSDLMAAGVPEAKIFWERPICYF